MKNSTAIKSALVALFGLNAAFAGNVPPPDIIHSFTNSKGDGSQPIAGLVANSAGVLYGTTSGGGRLGNGTVFALTPPATPGAAWTETILYKFTGTGGDGSKPHCTLVIGPAGELYGTTLAGGLSGHGTVFELTPPSVAGAAWTETVLYQFTNANGDGAAPLGGVILGSGGSLFGTTSAGGTSTHGTVYQLTPPATSGGAWQETILHTFTGANNDGAQPESELTLGNVGQLYGTTFAGGKFGLGTVYRLTPPTSGTQWTENLLYSFAGNGDGASPTAGVAIGAAGLLYGTTSAGGSANLGTVYQLIPTSPNKQWKANLIHQFVNSAGDGTVPYGGVIRTSQGKLYGTTTTGGTLGGGIVFQLTPPTVVNGVWPETILYNFGGPNDGSQPQSAPVFGLNGQLYGTTSKGGLGFGTAYQVAP